MPKRPNFTPIPTASGWMVSIPANMIGTENREQRFFEDDKAAGKLAKRLRAEYAAGMRGGVIDAGLARMAAEAVKILESCGLSILDAAKIVAKQFADAKGTDETFRERFDRFTRENETRWSARYHADMEKSPRWVGNAFMESRCAVISDAAIEAALRANGADSVKTVKQCAAMLRAYRTPAERRAVALLLFAGIRPDGKLGRLDWSDVGAEHITVHPETSKTNTDRHIPIKPRLARLLRGRPASGPVIPPKTGNAESKRSARPPGLPESRTLPGTRSPVISSPPMASPPRSRPWGTQREVTLCLNTTAAPLSTPPGRNTSVRL